MIDEKEKVKQIVFANADKLRLPLLVYGDYFSVLPEGKKNHFTDRLYFEVYSYWFSWKVVVQMYDENHKPMTKSYVFKGREWQKLIKPIKKQKEKEQKELDKKNEEERKVQLEASLRERQAAVAKAIEEL